MYTLDVIPSTCSSVPNGARMRAEREGKIVDASYSFEVHILCITIRFDSNKRRKEKERIKKDVKSSVLLRLNQEDQKKKK